LRNQERRTKQMKSQYQRSAGGIAILFVLLLVSSNSVVYAGTPPVQPVAFRFTGTPPPGGDATLIVVASRDINQPDDFIEVRAEGIAGNSLGKLFDDEKLVNEAGEEVEACDPNDPGHASPDANCVGFETETVAVDFITIPQDMLTDFAANRSIRFVMVPSPDVGRLEFLSLRLRYTGEDGKIYGQWIVDGPGIGILLNRQNPKRSFRVRALSGDQEVPPVVTDATGRAKLSLNATETKLNFKLEVRDLEAITAIHIHCAPEGVNGPVGITLFSGGPVTQRRFRGTITAPDTGNQCDWANLADAAIEIRQGNAYVNGHTVDFPAGQIRGQIEGQFREKALYDQTIINPDAVVTTVSTFDNCLPGEGCLVRPFAQGCSVLKNTDIIENPIKVHTIVEQLKADILHVVVAQNVQGETPQFGKQVRIVSDA
jgi:hypothetical protein